MQIAIGCMQYDAIYIQSVSVHNAVAAYELFSDAYIGSKRVRMFRGRQLLGTFELFIPRYAGFVLSRASAWSSSPCSLTLMIAPC